MNKKIKVALVNIKSPFLISDTVMPPLGLQYLSSFLTEHDVDVDIVDFAADGVFNGYYDIYAFTATTPQYLQVKEYIHYFRDEFGSRPKIKAYFVLGGAHATAFREQCLLDGFDSVVVGEGEEALLAICKAVERGETGCVKGIVEARQIHDINVIPFPDRTFPGFEKYDYKLHGLKATTMITSRGCPFHCDFCCNTWGNKVRMRTAANVLAEAKEIEERGFKALQFYDDTFTLDKKRVIDICKGLKALNMKWRCFIHASTVDSNLLRIMQMSGCVEVGIGVESGSQQILDTIHKKTTVSKVVQVCSMCHEIGLRIKTFLMVGLPGESHETIRETIEFLRLAKPDDFDIACYTPFPRTEIWENTDKYDIQFDKLRLDFSKMYYKGRAGEYACQVSTSKLSSEDIEAARDYIEFLFHQTKTSVSD